MTAHLDHTGQVDDPDEVDDDHTDTPATRMLNAAHTYVKHGYAVIPLWELDNHGECACRSGCGTNAGKHPRINAWHKRYAETGPDVQEYWGELYPGANIGIVTGPPSNVWAIDIDTDHGGEETWRTLRDGTINELLAPNTRTHTTGGGGRHYLYQWPHDGTIIHNSGSAGWRPGVDIRGIGGFIVAPPSVSGKGPYTLDHDVPPTQCPTDLRDNVTGNQHQPASVHVGGLPDPTRPALQHMSPRLRDAVGEIVDTGKRSERLNHIVRLAYEDGLTQAEAAWLHHDYCEATGKHAGNPDWSARDAATIWAKKDTEEHANRIHVPAPTTPPGTRSLYVPGHPLNLIDLVVLIEDDEQEPEWLIPGFLQRGCSYVLASEPKVGKSLLGLDVSCRLAAGRHTAPVTVGYADRENKPAQLRKRLLALGYKAAELTEHLRYYSFPPMAPLDTRTGAATFVNQVLADGVKLLILDTVARFVEGNESDADTANALYNHTLTPLAAAGVTVLRLDHFGKDAGKGIRGSSAKIGDVDAVWELTKRSPTLLRLKCTHDRTGEHTPSFGVRRGGTPLVHTFSEEAQRVEDHEDDSQEIGGVTIQGQALTADEVVEALGDGGAPDHLTTRQGQELLREAGLRVRSLVANEGIRLWNAGDRR